ncbi:hypothetical protein Dda_4628 [Drechslerella dactyloides]|uniref:HIT domain-containing protein n=1 Tax=Drechslerella dactyloides TaxID=74499 RepID=A0AAD6IY17_DREDA|nr:hypothetical protein Dda_4628 [Drechslerella dactyloides]
MTTDITAAGPFKFIPQGAIVQEWVVGGRNIVLGFKDPAEYAKSNPAFFGATIGRWDKKYWTGPVKETSKDGSEILVYSYKSPHLDEKFPGALDVSVRYTVRTERTDEADISVLEIEFEAQLAPDSPEDWAVISMTNHSYFNIGDQSTIAGTQVTIPDNTNIETNEVDIPTGKLKPFPGVESGVPFTLGPEEPDIDNGFALMTDVAAVPMDSRSKHQLRDPTPHGHAYNYTGKYIETEPRPDGTLAYGKRAGFCVEPARYTNAANMPEWKHMVLLRKGQTYGSRVVWKAWKREIPSLKLVDTPKVYAFLDIQPLSKGHALVIPKTHGEKLTDIPDEELAEMLPVAKKLALAVGAKDYNILQNNGRIAHQVVDHVHVHMVGGARQIPKPNEEEGLTIGWPAKQVDSNELKAYQEELKGKL